MRLPIPIVLSLTLLAAGCGNDTDLIPFGGHAEDAPGGDPDVPFPQDPADDEDTTDPRNPDDPDSSRPPDRDPGDRDPGDGGGPGCTLTQGYWKNHEEAWPISALVIGNATYSAAELDALLGTPVSGDASLILAHQLIAARLNIASGADTTQEVDDALDASEQWMLVNADADGRLPYHGGAHAEASALADTLAAFNEGAIGPGHCD